MKVNDLLDDYSRAPVPDQARSGALSITLVLTGIAITLPAFMAGASLAGSLGMERAVGAFLLGAAILALCGAATGCVGADRRLSTAMILRDSFGTRGVHVVNGVMALVILGWFGVTAELFAQAAVHSLVLVRGAGGPALPWVLGGGVVMTATILFGFRGMERLATIAVPLMLVFMLGVAWMSSRMPAPAGAPVVHGDALGFGAAVSGVVGSYMAGIILFPDLTRYARGRRAAVLSSVAGFGIAYPAVLLLAAVPALSLGVPDFIEIVSRLGLGVGGLLLVVFATWTTNASNLYSGSLLLAEIFTTPPRWVLTVAAGALGTLLAAIGLAGRLVDFLVLLGTVLPPIAGIYLADHFLRRGAPATRTVNGAGFTCWIGAVAVATGLDVFVLSPTGIVALDGLLIALATRGVLHARGH